MIILRLQHNKIARRNNLALCCWSKVALSDSVKVPSHIGFLHLYTSKFKPWKMFSWKERTVNAAEMEGGRERQKKKQCRQGRKQTVTRLSNTPEESVLCASLIRRDCANTRALDLMSMDWVCVPVGQSDLTGSVQQPAIINPSTKHTQGLQETVGWKLSMLSEFVYLF